MMQLLHVFAFYVTRVHLGKCAKEKRRERDIVVDQQNISNMLRKLYKTYCDIDVLSFYNQTIDGKNQEN